MEARPRWPGWVLVACSCITRRLKAKATQGQVGLDNHHKGYHHHHQHYQLPPLGTPCLNEKTDSGKTHLQDLVRWWRTSQRVDIPKISQFYWALFEKTRFLCFYIIKSMARKGYFGPKSDFRGSKIPPRGASST